MLLFIYVTCIQGLSKLCALQLSPLTAPLFSVSLCPPPSSPSPSPLIYQALVLSHNDVTCLKGLPDLCMLQQRAWATIQTQMYTCHLSLLE